MLIQGMKPLMNGSGYLNVVANSIGELTLKVLDTQGRFAKRISTEIEQGFQELCVNLNDLTNGTYVLNAFNGDTFIKSFKFTVE